MSEHFSDKEMACRCDRPECDAMPMKAEFMDMIERLRTKWGAPLVVTSGTRCLFWNKAVGGAPNSQHIYGKACDFHMNNSDEILNLGSIAEELGFGGIGAGKYHLIHVDTGPSGRRWTYPTK